jgi:hypothetical protein
MGVAPLQVLRNGVEDRPGAHGEHRGDAGPVAGCREPGPYRPPGNWSLYFPRRDHGDKTASARQKKMPLAATSSLPYSSVTKIRANLCPGGAKTLAADANFLRQQFCAAIIGPGSRLL